MDVEEVILDPVPPYAAMEIDHTIETATQTRSDGRIDIDLDSKLGAILSQLHIKEHEELPLPTSQPQDSISVVPLNIVIQIVGSRGDVQPFIALGQELHRFGHRVRLATHDVFEDFVKQSGLEFFPIGGDPVELMAYMVKNPGLLPNMKTLKGGEIQKKRSMIAKMLDGCWKSCIELDPVTKRPFVAEAIIANPPSFAHVHCAQALGIPLHLMFTMPWTSTKHFSHPLTNIRNTALDSKMANYLSYGIVDLMTWQGLGDVVNAWRRGLGLESLSASSGPLLVEKLRIPFTYCWSPALVPKPNDWPTNIDVTGFIFREPSKYSPPEDLDRFLRSGPPPVYIGFGSIVVDDPERFSNMFLEAVQAANVRAIISRGWSKFGDKSTTSENIFYLDDCPHEWLFQRVSAVVHHGGAGTTACGLFHGRPTVIVPFFGDQPFWGEMIAAARAGPSPIHNQSLTVQNLTEAVKFCLQPQIVENAATLSQKIRAESGTKAAVASFHRSLPIAEKLTCAIMPNLPAAWLYKKGDTRIKLSKFAAATLLKCLRIEQKHLKIYHTSPITIQGNGSDPISSGTLSLVDTTTYMASKATGIITKPIGKYQKSRELSRTNPEMEQNSGKLAFDAAASSAKSAGMLILQFFKGTMIDLPVAVADGLKSMPKLYGEEVAGRAAVTDWKSGFVVAGKSFTQGIQSGFNDVTTLPQNRKTSSCSSSSSSSSKHSSNIRSVTTGLAKSAIGFTTKTSAALLGLVAYPADGMAKSIHALSLSPLPTRGPRRQYETPYSSKVVTISKK